MSCAEVALEGNIGVGKSTMIKMLKRHIPNLVIHDEPIYDIWTRVPLEDEMINVFSAFYQNPIKYASCFQTLTFQTRRHHNRKTSLKELLYGKIDNLLQRHILTPPSIQERSIVGDYIFGTVNYKLGNMDKIQYACYNYVALDEMKRVEHPSIYIYLYAPANICYQRYQARDRPDEKITMDYLMELETVHNQVFYGEWKNGHPYYIVNVSGNIDSDAYKHSVNSIVKILKNKKDDYDISEITSDSTFLFRK